jgi:hypothetical protein
LKRVVSLVTAVTAVGAAVAAALWLAVPAAAAPTRYGGSGHEYFQLMTTSATATTIPVIAAGVFTAAGVDHEDTSKNVDTLVFPNGSFKVNHAHIRMNVYFSKTCLRKVSGRGTVKLFDGTGAYKGISGKPVATLAILAIAARTAAGGCSMTKPPVAFQQLISASGKITL